MLPSIRKLEEEGMRRRRREDNPLFPISGRRIRFVIRPEYILGLKYIVYIYLSNSRNVRFWFAKPPETLFLSSFWLRMFEQPCSLRTAGRECPDIDKRDSPTYPTGSLELLLVQRNISRCNLAYCYNLIRSKKKNDKKFGTNIARRKMDVRVTDWRKLGLFLS